MVAARLSDLAGRSSTLGEGGVRQSLQEIDSGVEALTAAYVKSTQEEVERVNKRAQDLNDRLHFVARASVTPQQRVVAVIRPNRSQSIVIPALNVSSGQTIFTVVHVCAGPFTSDRRGSSVHARAEVHTVDYMCRPETAPELKEGEFDEVMGKVEHLSWNMTVNAVEKHWFAPTTATITLSPAPAASPSGLLQTTSAEH